MRAVETEKLAWLERDYLFWKMDVKTETREGPRSVGVVVRGGICSRVEQNGKRVLYVDPPLQGFVNAQATLSNQVSSPEHLFRFQFFSPVLISPPLPLTLQPEIPLRRIRRTPSNQSTQPGPSTSPTRTSRQFR